MAEIGQKIMSDFFDTDGKDIVNYAYSPSDFSVGTAVREQSSLELAPFADTCVNFQEGFTDNQSYYISAEVEQDLNNVQTIDIILQKVDDSNSVVKEQFIKTIYVAKGNNTTPVGISAVITPNDTYNRVLFELKRTYVDYSSYYEYINAKDNNANPPRIVTFKENSIKLIKVGNVVGSTPWKKIGIQGAPGLLFILNGEEMHVGRSGIYELYHEGISITSLGVIFDDDTKRDELGDNFFVIDYKVESKEGNK